MENKISVRYNNKLSHCKVLVPCKVCGSHMRASGINKHMKIVHGIRHQLVCVWCLEFECTTRPKGEEKVRQYLHKHSCFSRCRDEVNCKIGDNSVAMHSGPLTIFCDDNIPLRCITENLLNSFTIQHWALEQVPLTEQDLSPAYPYWMKTDEGVTSENLRFFHNKCTIDPMVGFDPFLQLAFCFKENLVWWVIRVKFTSWNDFMSFFLKHSANIYILPHSSMCRHGGETHRHMVLVMPQTYAIVAKTDLRLVPQFYSIDGSTIENWKNPLTLMRKILQFAKTACSCDKNCASECNYHTFRPVIPLADMFAMMYIPGGMEIYFTDLDLPCEAGNLKSLRKNRQGRWLVEYCEVAKYQYLIFPLPLNFQLVRILPSTLEHHDDFLIIGSYIFKVSCNNSLVNLPRIEWNAHQLRNYNCFFRNSASQFFGLSLTHQQSLHKIFKGLEPVEFRELERLRFRIKCLEEKNQTLEAALTIVSLGK